MSALITLSLVGLGAAGLEIVSGVLSRLTTRTFIGPVPRRTEFLAEQSRMLSRLAAGLSAGHRVHPVLGWDYGIGERGKGHTMNAQGLRAVRTYASETAPGVVRVAAFGDSFVYCNEVADADTWPRQIETGWNAEVLNYGVGGYGPDQALLRFRDEGTRLRPQVVVIGFTSVMAARVVSRYRRFQDARDGPWFKPRFILEGEGLRVIPAPVASREDAERLLEDPASVANFGQDDYWYNPALLEHRLYAWSATYRLLSCVAPAIRRRYLRADRLYNGRVLNPQSGAFKILKRIFREFTEAIRSAGAEPLVLMLPTRSDVERHAAGEQVSYEPFRAHLEQMGHSVLDPVELLASSIPVAELTCVDGHYSEKANAHIAKAVAETLRLTLRQDRASVRPGRTAEAVTNDSGCDV